MSDALNADVVICGAGIAGAAAAYFLAVEHGVRQVSLIDEGPPLALTSDKSTECYRNWWPGPGSAMVDFSNRSIDLLENIARRTNNRIAMARRGYVFATAQDAGVDELRAQAEAGSALGSGELREHGKTSTGYIPHREFGWQGCPEGIDLLTDKQLIQKHFPAFSAQTKGILHARRCGWITAQQLGAFYLEEARAAGARIITGKMTAVDLAAGQVSGVRVVTNGREQTIATDTLVLSPGPYLHEAAQLLGLNLPVYCEGHVKVILRDARNGMPADLPLVLWNDPVELPWTEEERAALADDPGSRYLLEQFPGGVHGRPTGAAGHHYALMLWTYEVNKAAPEFPMSWDPHMPEIIIRGMSRMLPGMGNYLDALPKTEVDGGYYCKTPENRPLVGPLPVRGAYVNAAYSGYGIMTSCAGGELIAKHITGNALPSYADALLPSRFDDPTYLDEFADATAGQM